MAEDAVRALAWSFVGAFTVLLVQAWLVQRSAATALSGKGFPMLAQALAFGVIVAFVVAMALCTWADCAVSSSVRRATGG